MLTADVQVSLGQLFIAVPTLLAAITGYLAFKATKKRDETASQQTDRKVALDEFNAINEMRQKMVADLRTALAESESEVEAGLARELKQEEAYNKLQRRCDEEKFTYQNQVYLLQRQLDKYREAEK